MKRALTILLAGAAAAGFWLVAGAASSPKAGTRYTVELDNAFGMIEGGDLKIAGVRAGKITGLKIDRKTHRALVSFEITKNGFGSLRSDVHCETRPQSLIGEYFMDCMPGIARQNWDPKQVIPVTHTASTVPPDLVGDIMRIPQRQRLRIIISELGAGVAGNGANLQAALKRAVPALRETDVVLKKLAGENKTLADLAVNADTVLRDLAGNRKDVARWVVQAGNAATASAERRTAIAAGFHKLPRFLQELRPTMKDLGDVADTQGLAFHNLDLSAKQLTRFFGDLGPFAEASRPAIRALGKAAVTGNKAVRAATPTVAQLNAFAQGAPELGKNLAIILQHLDDPSHAIENDPRAVAQTGRPAPTGYSGFEALLQYVFDQTMTTNIFDQNVHLLAIAAFPSAECSSYADAAAVKGDANKQKRADCSAALGPIQPGINAPDPTAPGGAAAARAKGLTTQGAVNRQAGGPNAPKAGAGAPAAAATPPSSGGLLSIPGLPAILPGGARKPDLPAVDLPGGVTAAVPALRASDNATHQSLLDYLLGS
jgi:ABC-type transporter Mla subunit MlaD